MTRNILKLAVLAKIEATYGADAVPSGAANAIQLSNCKYRVVTEEISRKLLKRFMGHQGVILVAAYVEISGEVEISGTAEESELPAWGVLMRMCGFSEEITSRGDVEYRPRSSGFEAGTLYYNLDRVNHVCLGARGNVKAIVKAGEIPRFHFEFKGLLGEVTDEALPVVDHTAFVPVSAVSKANTVFKLHGWVGGTEGVEIDLGAQIEPRMLINKESVELVTRHTRGEATVESGPVASKDWFAVASAHDVGKLFLQHGPDDGAVVMFDAPAVQIGMPEYGETQQISHQKFSLFLKPASADKPELLITVSFATRYPSFDTMKVTWDSTKATWDARK